VKVQIMTKVQQMGRTVWTEMQSDSYRSDKCSIIAPRCDHVQYL